MGNYNIFTNLEAEGSKEQIENWINQLNSPNLTEEKYKQIRYEFTKSVEGYSQTAYRDTVNKMTVGIGFNMDSNTARSEWVSVFGENGTDFDAVYNNKIELKDSEIKQLFDYSLEIRENEIFANNQYGDIKNNISYSHKLIIESMWYNSPELVKNPTTFHTELHNYFETGDETYLTNAKDQILDYSNRYNNNGIAHRRLKEAAIFSGDADLDLSAATIAKVIEQSAGKDTKVVIDHNENLAIRLNEDNQLTIDIKEGSVTTHEAIEYIKSLAPDLNISVIDSRSVNNDSASYYTIKSGDTLSAIAESNDISLDDLLSANPNITNPNQINIGDQIILPRIDISSYFIEYKNPLKEILDNFISDMDKILEDNQWLIEEDRIGANEDYFLLKEAETFTITIDPIKSGSYYIEDGIKTQFYFDFAGKTISKNDTASNDGWTTIDWSATTGSLQLDWASFNIQQIDGANLYEYDGTATIDNSSLDLSVRTDWDKNFASEEGFVIGDGDWFAYMPDNYVNGDGWHNVWGAGNVSDWYRPANDELSYFETPQLLSDVRLLLGSKTIMADISNYYSDAFNYLNIDPLILDLNGDGVKLISYENSNVVFDVDNDQYAERTGWVSAQDAASFLLAA